MATQRISKMVKTGKRTYFLDLRKSQNGQKYILLTQSELVDEGQWKQQKIILFPDQAQEFAEKLNELTSKIEEF